MKENYDKASDIFEEITDKINSIYQEKIMVIDKLLEVIKNIPLYRKEYQDGKALKNYYQNVINMISKKYNFQDYENVFKKLMSKNLEQLRKKYEFLYINLEKIGSIENLNITEAEQMKNSTKKRKGMFIKQKNEENENKLKIKKLSLNLKQELFQNVKTETSDDKNESISFSVKVDNEKLKLEKLDKLRVFILAYKYDQNFVDMFSVEATEKYCDICMLNGKQIKMEFSTNTSELCCPQCGYENKHVDIRSGNVVDKNSTMTTSSTITNPTLNFNQTLNKLCGSSKLEYTKQQLDKIYLELFNRKIYQLSKLIALEISSIVKHIIKSGDDSFKKFQNHIWGLTNLIRGVRILDLTEENKQELRMVYNKILSDYNQWEKNNQNENKTESKTFVNCIAIQLCFHILEYPPEIILSMKGIDSTENINYYQIICDILCKKNNWPSINLNRYNILHYGKIKTLNDFFDSGGEKNEFVSSSQSKNCLIKSLKIN